MLDSRISQGRVRGAPADRPRLPRGPLRLEATAMRQHMSTRRRGDAEHGGGLFHMFSMMAMRVPPPHWQLSAGP